MELEGFGKGSGPAIPTRTQTQSQIAFGTAANAASPSPQFNRIGTSNMSFGSGISQDTMRMQSPIPPPKGDGFPEASRLDSSPFRSGDRTRFSSGRDNSVPQQSFAMVGNNEVPYGARSTSPIRLAEPHVRKRSRSPPVPPSGSSTSLSRSLEDDNERLDSSPFRLGNHTRFSSRLGDSVAQETFPAVTNTEIFNGERSTSPIVSTESHILKRSRSPPVPPPGSSTSLAHSQETDYEREMQAKAKRLARFGVELGQEVSNLHEKDKKSSETKFRQNVMDKNVVVNYSSGETMAIDDRGMLVDRDEYEPSAAIVGSCQDMCPESERDERERKGDLDRYERLNGDRNQTHISLAVKKYNRTAEREASLIRSMPVLRKTMDYLLNLLDQPYDDKFLGMYNFLWDRMRAIRMDLRMQHIFNEEAIVMLEQMIRLHILAMHELCEYTKGEGFTEGFDAHLNIEQMNKASVELFQMYDDHRKKGVSVMTENEFRGYYALLKLDRHPGYKVEPAELSLDLAKMAPTIRCTSEISFARAVARACRTGNFIAFFRLARKATYLQACLMHAHFSKLRTNALASLHSGLQNNQGIPVAQVVQWLGMEEEDIENLLKFHGFAIKNFEEAYMVKEGSFFNSDAEYNPKCSELVHSKRSRKIVNDVSKSSQLSDLEKNFANGISTTYPVKRARPIPTSGHDYNVTDTPSYMMLTVTHEENKVPSIKVQLSADDAEMPDFEDLSTPKDDRRSQPRLAAAASNTVLLQTDKHYVDKHPDAVMLVSRVDSSVNFATSDGAQVAQPSTWQHIRPESSVMTEERDVQIQTSEAPTFELLKESPAHQKEIHDPRHEALYLATIKKSEAAKTRLKMIIRTWKRRASRKREMREQRNKLANLAFNSLSLGPPVYFNNTLSSEIGEKLNLDIFLKERNVRHRKSWSRLNIADLVGPILYEKNSRDMCLCWKVVICIHKSDKENNCNDFMPSWLMSKLMGTRSNTDDELVAVSSGLAIWKKIVDAHHGFPPSICYSVVREVCLEDYVRGTSNDMLVGTNALIYVLSKSAPWESHRIHINMLISNIPSQSKLPLLILCGNACGEDAQVIINRLGLKDVGMNKVTGISIVYLAEEICEVNIDGFFSDVKLRGCLEWLAEQSLPQPTLTVAKTRELVLEHLNSSTLELQNSGPWEANPNHYVEIFNKALDQSAKQIQEAANKDFNGWPCPEIDLLDARSDDRRVKEANFPKTGWSSAANIKPVVDAIISCKLPSFSHDLSFLNHGSQMRKEVQLLKTWLEEYLVNYLTHSGLISNDLALKEAYLMLQKGAALELRGSHFYLIPRWATIFQRIYNWRLMKLTAREFASAYILGGVARTISGQMYHNGLGTLSMIKSNTSTAVDSFQFGHHMQLQLNHHGPLLDEMIELSCGLLSDKDEVTLLRSPETNNIGAVQLDSHLRFSRPSMDETIMRLDENQPSSTGEEVRLGRPSEADRAIVIAEKNRGKATSLETCGTGSSKLRMLLEQCKMLQDRIDQKLSLYF